jgi:sulfiredoxin
MKPVKVRIKDIYVPAAHSKRLEEDKVDTLAEDILENGLKEPIHVLHGKGRYVLQSGLHRLEAVRFLDEEDITVFIVQARKF